jgi:hypothetical protein
MANTLKFGNGEWYGKEGTILAYNDENRNYKPLPFNFERSSSATTINKQGLIETVGANEPRIDYKDNSKGALLLEPTRSNLLPYSEDFENSDWNKNAGTTITNNYAISPDGTLNASRYLGTGASGLGDKFTLSATDYTISFWVKSNTSENQFCRLIGDSSNVSENLLITTEWTRLSYTFTGSGLSNKTNGIFRDSGDNDIDILIYGAQLEQGSYATSYIPTSGGAVTRVKDTCLKDNINTSIINSSYPFSMYVESTYVGGNNHVLSFAKKPVSNNYYVISITGNNEVWLDARANGSTELIESGVTLLDGQKFKVAVTMESATSGKICVNGTVVSKTNFSNQAVNNEINDLLLGQLRTVSDTGKRLPLSNVKLYNTALTDAELIALTTI